MSSRTTILLTEPDGEHWYYDSEIDAIVLEFKDHIVEIGDRSYVLAACEIIIERDAALFNLLYNKSL